MATVEVEELLGMDRALDDPRAGWPADRATWADHDA